MDQNRTSVGTVLYKPELTQLEQLMSSIPVSSLRLFLFINGPIGPSVEAQLSAVKNCKIIRSVTNIGLGAGLNALAECAGSEGFNYILLLDQDSIPSANLPEALLSRMDGAKAAGARPAVVGPMLVPPDGQRYKPVWYSRRPEPYGSGAAAVDFLPTSGSLVSIDAWRAVGPFRSDYFIDGIDVEWCFRAWNCGFSCLLAEDVHMIHRWGNPTKKGESENQILQQSGVRLYYYIRNNINLTRLRHVDRLWKLRILGRLAAQIALLLVKGRGRRKIDIIALAVRDGLASKLGPAPIGIEGDSIRP